LLTTTLAARLHRTVAMSGFPVRALVALVALLVAGVPASASAQPGREASVRPSLAPATAIARAAVVTLTLPGRSALHGLLVDDWPDEEDLLDTPDDRDIGELTVGSAVIVEASGIAVTTARLGRRALTLKAVTSDGRRLSAMVVGRDDETDVAVVSLCCDPDPLPSIALGDSDRLRAGDWVVAIGAPFGLGASATASIVSALTADDGDGSGYLIQTGPSVTSGYAGGPLVDTTGAMVGLVVGNNAGTGIAQPSSTLRKIVTALLEDGRVRRGSLGISGQTLDPEVAQALRAPDARGVVIVDVRRESPADLAGLRPGDIVYEVDGRRFDSAGRLARAIGRLAPDRVVRLKIRQRGRDRTLDVRLGEEPDDEAIGSVRWRTQALLGADVTAITSDMGVMVSSVDDDGPAARAGIRRADVIREVNGRPIRSLPDLDRALGGLTVDSRHLVLLQRGPASLYVTFTPTTATFTPEVQGRKQP
jgi:S1-C subfamily serine protease